MGKDRRLQQSASNVGIIARQEIAIYSPDHSSVVGGNTRESKCSERCPSCQSCSGRWHDPDGFEEGRGRRSLAGSSL